MTTLEEIRAITDPKEVCKKLRYYLMKKIGDKEVYDKYVLLDENGNFINCLGVFDYIRDAYFELICYMNECMGSDGIHLDLLETNEGETGLVWPYKLPESNETGHFHILFVDEEDKHA